MNNAIFTEEVEFLMTDSALSPNKPLFLMFLPKGSINYFKKVKFQFCINSFRKA